jgi:hypothetical protein
MTESEICLKNTAVPLELRAILDNEEPSTTITLNFPKGGRCRTKKKRLKIREA